MELLGGSLRLVVMLAYLFVGLVQFFAIWDGAAHWLGVGEFFGFILAAIAAYIPVAGNILGFFGATDIWGWDWWWAALMFFWIVPLYLGALVIDAVSDR